MKFVSIISASKSDYSVMKRVPPGGPSREILEVPNNEALINPSFQASIRKFPRRRNQKK